MEQSNSESVDSCLDDFDTDDTANSMMLEGLANTNDDNPCKQQQQQQQLRRRTHSDNSTTGDDEDQDEEAEFGAAASQFAALVAAAATSIANDQLLYMYSRYKLATEGACPAGAASPGFWRGPAVRAKWHAWRQLGASMTPAQARREYVQMARHLTAQHATSDNCNTTATATTITQQQQSRTVVSGSGMLGVRVSVPCAELLTDSTATDDPPAAAAVDAERDCVTVDQLCRWARDGQLSLLQQQHHHHQPETVPQSVPPSADATGVTTCRWSRLGQHGLAPLHWAADRGHGAVLLWLLDTVRVPVDLTDSSGQTALHHAACGGHAPLVAALLARGATSDWPDADGCRPLELTDSASVMALLSDHAAAALESGGGRASGDGGGGGVVD